MAGHLSQSHHRPGLMFLTRLPCPHWCDHHPAYLMRSMAYFPIIGAMVGGWSAVFFIAAATLWNQHIAIVISTFASVWLTGLSCVLVRLHHHRPPDQGVFTRMAWQTPLTGLGAVGVGHRFCAS